MLKNGGHIDYKQSGTMDLLPLRVFYNLDYIVNILALVVVTSQFRVTNDNNNKPAMFVHTVPDSFLNFSINGKDCTLLILLLLMYLILTLTLTLSLVPSKRTRSVS